MKKFLLLALLAAAVACKSKSGAVEKYAVIAPSEADAQQKAKAYELGKRVLNACNTSRFKAFSPAEATEQVRKNTTPERITRTCQKFRVRYGTFRDLELVQVIAFRKSDKAIYRYKADYQKKYKLKELRVTMEGNKVAGIQSKDWTDAFQP
jgi:hypothetical protein